MSVKENMSSVRCLRDFVTERLTAAAEEIFGVFEKTVAEYEEELDRQRRLLDVVWKPEVKLRRIELPQQHVCNEKAILADQQICDHDRNPSLDQKDLMLPHVKEEQEEHCNRLLREELIVKQEKNSFMLTLTDVDIDDSETEPKDNQQLLSYNSPVTKSQDQLLQQHVCKEEEEVHTDQQFCTQNKNLSLEQEGPDLPQIKEDQGEHGASQEGEQLVLKQETKTFMLTPPCEESGHSEPEAPSYHQLLSVNSPVAESQDQKGIKQVDSGFSRKTELMSKTGQGKNRSYSKNVQSSSKLKTECNADTGKKSFKCDTCGKAFNYKSELIRHISVHTGERPYSCDKCGKSFRLKSTLFIHMITHTSKKPQSCKTCGKCFGSRNECLNHMRIHTGENLYLCKTCGKSLKSRKTFLVHMRAHTSETPYLCNFFGRNFIASSILSTHLKTHTGEKPYSCETCGKSVVRKHQLKLHIRTHTGEKPHSCETCGKRFVTNHQLKLHVRTHTGEKPHSCETCGKRFITKYALKVHIRSHTDERPYSCDSCGKRFKARPALKAHMNRHTAKKSPSRSTCEEKIVIHHF